jgi:hypothetical protein
MMALGIVGAVVGAVGQFMSMQAAANAAEYNAKVAERNAAAVRAQTGADADDKRRSNRRVISSMRAAYGANGFEMAGSPLDVMSDTVQEQEYDVAKLKYAGELKAIGYTQQADLYSMEADNARAAAPIGLASGILSGVGNAISNAPPGSSLLTMAG